MGAWRGPGRWAGGAAARMMPADAWRQDGQLPLRAVPLILMYHGVADVAEDPNKLCVTPGRFAEQMAWLERHRLRGVGIGTLVDAMRAGHAKGDGDDGDYVPDLRSLRAACESVVAHARRGQTVILTSTTYVGTTRELLADPLQRRGLRVGSDVFVAFSPERIDPGNPDHLQRKTPRVVGGVTPQCARRAAMVIGHLTDVVYLVSSPDAAEATKLYENIFRAVSLALANEFADACGALSLDPVEVTLAAGTKPYGFLGALPGPGVGGHCIPCDPHYLLWQLGRDGQRSPLIEQAMTSIRLRPGRVAERARQVLAADGRTLAGARVIVVGVSYKAGVQDLRESSALPLIADLMGGGAEVSYYDPLIPRIQRPGGAALEMESRDAPAGPGWDLAIVHTLHPGVDYSWVQDCPRVLDATYQFDTAPHRVVV
jgi:UDP-N-acetyl-D-glucosamine dehydrogenase